MRFYFNLFCAEIEEHQEQEQRQPVPLMQAQTDFHFFKNKAMLLWVHCLTLLQLMWIMICRKSCMHGVSTYKVTRP